jgi:hypothetical protein
MIIDYGLNIESTDELNVKIASFNTEIATINKSFFAALESANANLNAAILKNTQTGGKIDKATIEGIYQDAASQQNQLEQNRVQIINNIRELADYKILLEYTNANADADAGANSVAGGAAGSSPVLDNPFDTMSPEIMIRDTVTLYNLQYLQIFCKVLGIVIIIVIFFKYFSSITGMTSLSIPSIIPQVASLPQAVGQAAST